MRGFLIQTRQGYLNYESHSVVMTVHRDRCQEQVQTYGINFAHNGAT